MSGRGSDLSSIAGATSIPATAIPAAVRKDGKDGIETYKAALGFEQMLVKQLTKSLSDSAALGGSTEEGGEKAPAAYRDMVADQMAASIASAGGIGIADDLYKTLRKDGATK
jgi:Rod binding domain-containing protein